MHKFWKLAVLASLAALGLFALSGSALRPTSVSATIGTLTAPDTSVDSGEDIVITVPANMDSGDISITRTGVGSGSTAVFKVTDCNGCDDENRTGQAVTVDSSGAAGFDGTLEVTLTVTCTSDDPMVVHATQSNTEDLNVTCNAVENNVTVETESSDDTSAEFDYRLRGPGSACDKDFTQQDGDSNGYVCDDTDSDYSLEVTDMPSGFSIDDISCSDSGIPSSDITISEEDGTVDFTLGPGDSIDCTFTYTKGGTATPKPTATPTAPASVTVAVTPTSVGCQSSAFVTVTVKGAGGAAVANNTGVTIQASAGQVSPGTATTFGGSVLAVYTAPATQGGTVTITATSGGVTGTATLTVDCGTVPTAVPPTAVPTSSTGGGITPPSTGDAGLSTTSSSSLPTYLGFGLIALAVSLGAAGVLGVVRNRIR